MFNYYQNFFSSLDVKCNVHCSACLLFPTLSLCFTPPSLHQGSSSCTAVHEQRSFERKAEEDDGKVSFPMAGWISPGPAIHVASVSSQTALLFEREMGWGWGVPHPNRRHPENQHASVSPWRQAEWQTHRGTRLLSCLLFPPFPHTSQPPWAPWHPHFATLRSAEPACVLGGLRVLCVL